jgi:hypothetical protein
VDDPPPRLCERHGWGGSSPIWYLLSKKCFPIFEKLKRVFENFAKHSQFQSAYL